MGKTLAQQLAASKKTSTEPVSSEEKPVEEKPVEEKPVEQKSERKTFPRILNTARREKLPNFSSGIER
jgi:hypothetical protein